MSSNNITNKIYLHNFTDGLDLSTCRKLTELKHENVEKVLEWKCTFDYFCFTTPFYVETLQTVLRDKTHFIKHDVANMFVSFHQALCFLKEKNICHKNVNPANLKFNGITWVVGGLIHLPVYDTCYSSEFGMFLKSRRFLLKERNQLDLQGYNSDQIEAVPSDDMWNLVCIYVFTYYGFDPFNPTLLLYPSTEIEGNVINGLIQEITLKNNSLSPYGKHLMVVLTRTYEAYDYADILTIFTNNDDEHVNQDQPLDGEKCVVCWVKNISTRFKPCCHTICCTVCAKKVFYTKCPLCRSEISRLEYV